MTTVLILLIDLGTDMIPAISIAYEVPEPNIMLWKPRSHKYDWMVGTKLIAWSYLYIGEIETYAGFYSYFVVLNDYGIKPTTLYQLTMKTGIEPNPWDVYDPT